MTAPAADQEPTHELVEPRDRRHGEDWAWIEEWRARPEPTPWSTGLPISVYAAALVGCALWVITAGVSDVPILGLVLNLVFVGGLAPALWLSRKLPVLRWVSLGGAVGVLFAWAGLLLVGV